MSAGWIELTNLPKGAGFSFVRLADIERIAEPSYHEYDRNHYLKRTRTLFDLNGNVIVIHK
jgi:hypothetical protein